MILGQKNPQIAELIYRLDVLDRKIDYLGLSVNINFNQWRCEMEEKALRKSDLSEEHREHMRSQGFGLYFDSVVGWIPNVKKDTVINDE